MIKNILKYIGITLLSILILGIIYIATLFYPQFFFKNKLTVNQVTVYSDQEIPAKEMKQIIKKVLSKVKKSVLYKDEIKQSIFIANNPLRWLYFSNYLNKVGGINYVIFNHNIFLRKADIKNNKLFGSSGKIVPGNRTLDYFIAHEMTHTLEFHSMPWYKYPIKTNWVLEGYCEYIAHGSQSYESSLDQYLNLPENSGAKYYTRTRTLVAYLLEKEKIPVQQIWDKVDNYDRLIKLAIPKDKPKLLN